MVVTPQKIIDIFEKTFEADFNYEGDVENINYYNMFCKAGGNDLLFTFDSNINFFSCKTRYNNNEGILFIFAIPINDDRNYRSKYISEKIIKIIEILETSFIKVDYLRCDEVKIDKFVYLIAIKTRKNYE